MKFTVPKAWLSEVRFQLTFEDSEFEEFHRPISIQYFHSLLPPGAFREMALFLYCLPLFGTDLWKRYLGALRASDTSPTVIYVTIHTIYVHLYTVKPTHYLLEKSVAQGSRFATF